MLELHSNFKSVSRECLQFIKSCVYYKMSRNQKTHHYHHEKLKITRQKEKNMKVRDEIPSLGVEHQKIQNPRNSRNKIFRNGKKKFLKFLILG